MWWFDWTGCSYGYVVSLRYKLAVGVFIAEMPWGGNQRFSLDGDLECVNDACEKSRVWIIDPRNETAFMKF